MAVIEGVINRIKQIRGYYGERYDEGEYYEFCTNCDANLTLQKGYSPSLKYWYCRGCGQLQINPDMESDIVWYCDRCEAVLTDQEGFTEDAGEWRCTKCGYVSKLDSKNIYLTEGEREEEMKNPYRGLSKEDLLSLSLYTNRESVGGRDDIFRISEMETGRTYIEKRLRTYEKSIYEFLLEHPVAHMPRIVKLFEGANGLIVIEEYIEGRTIAELLEETLIPEKKAIEIVKALCVILEDLHNLPNPIIHRDIKPSNIMLSPEGEVYLLDMNVAKWYDRDQKDDTRYLGTEHYAAPEQVGYGLSASSPRTDTYAVGVLMNVMITGRYPKEQHVEGEIRKIIERCTSLEAEKRYTAKELFDALESCERNRDAG
uniref:serine/threonine protein kinase n=1 Tax=Eubacterium cellulosolvens TaxID=29322 RepID=UPI0009E06C7F|nr:protein kinase [[Eubacterium] cellulosolvens]